MNLFLASFNCANTELSNQMKALNICVKFMLYPMDPFKSKRKLIKDHLIYLTKYFKT